MPLAMVPHVVRAALLFLFVAASSVLAAPPFALEIDLSEQKARLLQDGQIVYETPISSGRASHETPTGSFTITEKSEDHKSSLYGKIVGADGKVLTWDADSDMELPAGAKFVNAPMKHFLRYDGAVGLHAGYLPGYAASHGCVRLPPDKARLFFEILPLGTPVKVFGKAPPAPPPIPRAVRVRQPVVAPAAPATPAPLKWLPFIKRRPSS